MSSRRFWRQWRERARSADRTQSLDYSMQQQTRGIRLTHSSWYSSHIACQCVVKLLLMQKDGIQSIKKKVQLMQSLLVNAVRTGNMNETNVIDVTPESWLTSSQLEVKKGTEKDEARYCLKGRDELGQRFQENRSQSSVHSLSMLRLIQGTKHIICSLNIDTLYHHHTQAHTLRINIAQARVAHLFTVCFKPITSKAILFALSEQTISDVQQHLSSTSKRRQLAELRSALISFPGQQVVERW